ncbi:MAG: hypothetical protein U0931_15965 [Vulcanimicrobiota bacterium]
MKSAKIVLLMVLGAGAAAALVFLIMVMTRTGPPKMSQRELSHLTKIFLALRSSPQPAVAARQGKMLGLECAGIGNPYSGSSNETLTLVALPLPEDRLARSLPEASTLVFLDREPLNDDLWRYQVYLANSEGRPLGKFACGPKEVAEKLASLPEVR